MLEIKSPVQFDQILPNSINLCGLMGEEDLTAIGQQVVKDYNDDEQSRSDWMKWQERWMKLALQVVEVKNFPWRNAANVKYPLLSTAAIQFHARAFPALVPGTKKILARVIGDDLDGSKDSRATRVSLYMDYQLTCEMENWEEDTDKLALILPILGCAFKKTYYNPLEETNVSELVYAKDLVVNYWTKSLDTSPCITHIMDVFPNIIWEYTAAGIFREVDLAEPSLGDTPKQESNDQSLTAKVGGTRPATSDYRPYFILEQYRFIDLDGDGYMEPYIVTVEHTSQKVLRIVPNFYEEDIKKDENGQLLRITADKIFTKFSFIPNPDGGFYDVGFGLLLGAINDAANTLINQLLDAGTIANLQAGFLSKGIKIRTGNKRFEPGEWKVVDSNLDDLKKGIMPLPTGQPSQVLMSLLQFLLESGRQLATTTDITLGENPGQNQPAETSRMVMEQGAKVFTAIFRRIHRALGQEYKKLYKLNQKYLPTNKYFTVVDPINTEQQQIFKDDFRQDGSDIVPSSDPNVTTMSQKLAKANGLLQLLQLGLNVDEVKRRVLEAQEQPNIEVLMQIPPPQPDPKMVEIMEKAKYHNVRSHIELINSKFDNLLKLAQSEKFLADAAGIDLKGQMSELAHSLQVLQLEVDPEFQQIQQEAAPQGGKQQ